MGFGSAAGAGSVLAGATFTGSVFAAWTMGSGAVTGSRGCAGADGSTGTGGSAGRGVRVGLRAAGGDHISTRTMQSGGNFGGQPKTSRTSFNIRSK